MFKQLEKVKVGFQQSKLKRGHLHSLPLFIFNIHVETVAF